MSTAPVFLINYTHGELASHRGVMSICKCTFFLTTENLIRN